LSYPGVNKLTATGTMNRPSCLLKVIFLGLFQEMLFGGRGLKGTLYWCLWVMGS